MANLSAPKVSIIVPCLNEEETIEDLLEAIASQSYPSGALEVVIADGMSEDATRENIQQFQEKYPTLELTVTDNPERSIPSALNIAIQKARGDIIVRLDAHSIPSVDYVERCVDVLLKTDAANVGGAWVIEPGEDTWIGHGIAAAAAHPLGAGGARYRIGGPPGPVDTVPFGTFKREWLERVGRFDEKLLTNEDYEYNVRIREAGGEVYFDPEIQSVYLARSTVPALARQYARYGYWKAKMLRSNPRSIRWRQLMPPSFVVSLITLSVAAIFESVMRVALGAVLGVYLLLIFFAGSLQAWKRKDLSMTISFPIAIIVMHLSWGGAFIAGLISSFFGGRHGTH